MKLSKIILFFALSFACTCQAQVYLATAGTKVYAAAEGYINFSNDNGATWTKVNSGLPATRPWALAADGEKVVIGYERAAFISTDNGKSWTSIQKGLPTINTFDGFVLKENKIYGYSSNGVFVTEDNGVTWKTINKGFPFEECSALAFSGIEMFAGRPEGLFKSEIASVKWKQVKEFTQSYVNAIEIAGSAIFAGTNNDGIYISKDNAKTWISFSAGLPQSGYYSNVMPIYDLAINDKYLFAGTERNGVYRSPLNALGWEKVNNGMPKDNNLKVSFLAISGSNIYSGAGGNIYVSSDNGTTWTLVDFDPAATARSKAAEEVALKKAEEAKAAAAEAKAKAEKEKQGARIANFKSLVADAQNEFAENQGALKSEDKENNVQYYVPKKTLSSTESLIQVLNTETETYKIQILLYDLEKNLVEAMSYSQIFLDEINALHKSGNYTGSDYKNDKGHNVTELKDVDGNTIMELTSSPKTMVFNLYSKGIETKPSKKLTVKIIPRKIPVGGINFISFSPNSNYLSATSWKVFEMYGMNIIGGSTTITDTSGTVLLDTKDEGATASVFTPDGNGVLTATGVNGLKRYNVNDTASLSLSKISPDKIPFRILYTSDGKHIITGSMDGLVTVSEAETQKLTRSFQLSTDPNFILNMYLINNDKTLISHCNGIIIYSDLETGAEIKRLASRNGSGIMCSALSADKKTLVTKDAKNEALIWDAEKGEIKGNFETVAHQCCAVSPDGSLMVFGFTEGYYTFDGNGNFLRGWGGKNIDITALSFSPDGKYLAAGTSDGKIALFLNSEIAVPIE